MMDKLKALIAPKNYLIHFKSTPGLENMLTIIFRISSLQPKRTGSQYLLEVLSSFVNFSLPKPTSVASKLRFHTNRVLTILKKCDSVSFTKGLLLLM